MPYSSFLLIGLAIIYGLVSSITTLDTRLIQAKRKGLLSIDEDKLPNWIGFFYWAEWLILVAMFILNWKFALTVFLIKFILKVLPVLEVIGNVLMSPFKKKANRNFLIVHLDDHLLFRTGIKQCVTKHFINSKVHDFVSNAEALNFIAECYNNRRKIDLIITDFNHPGPDGLVFGKEVRQLQKQFRIETPIIMFTMCWDLPQLIEATQLGIFDDYIAKDVEEFEVIDAIRKRISPKTNV